MVTAARAGLGQGGPLSRLTRREGLSPPAA
jgi:hypothetical protein